MREQRNEHVLPCSSPPHTLREGTKIEGMEHKKPQRAGGSRSKATSQAKAFLSLFSLTPEERARDRAQTRDKSKLKTGTDQFLASSTSFFLRELFHQLVACKAPSVVSMLLSSCHFGFPPSLLSYRTDLGP
jgi:hypothetical protein